MGTMTLSERRRARRLTQQQVADALGVDRSSYAHIESSSRLPLSRTLISLAQFYTCSVDEVIAAVMSAKPTKDAAPADGAEVGVGDE